MFRFDLVAYQGFLVEKTQDLSNNLGKYISVKDKIRWGDWNVANYKAIQLSRSDLILA